jgi:hypothetical protein
MDAIAASSLHIRIDSYSAIPRRKRQGGAIQLLKGEGECSSNSLQMYLHADLRQKEEALSKVTPLDVPPGRFRPDDELLAFLEGL